MRNLTQPKVTTLSYAVNNSETELQNFMVAEPATCSPGTRWINMGITITSQILIYMEVEPPPPFRKLVSLNENPFVLLSVPCNMPCFLRIFLLLFFLRVLLFQKKLMFFWESPESHTDLFLEHYFFRSPSWFRSYGEGSYCRWVSHDRIIAGLCNFKYKKSIVDQVGASDPMKDAKNFFQRYDSQNWSFRFIEV